MEELYHRLVSPMLSALVPIGRIRELSDVGKYDDHQVGWGFTIHLSGCSSPFVAAGFARYEDAEEELERLRSADGRPLTLADDPFSNLGLIENIRPAVAEAIAEAERTGESQYILQEENVFRVTGTEPEKFGMWYMRVVPDQPFEICRQVSDADFGELQRSGALVEVDPDSVNRPRLQK